MTDDKRFAVLIDADNVSARYITYILDEVSNYGVATYKRIYGDWTKTSTSSWKDVLLENSITPIQQYSYTSGKNATDSAMIIDAMDILYSGKVDGFCIISSDSDFTKLASRLRESAMSVVGMGEKKTPKPFIAACNQFKYLEVLVDAEKKTEVQAGTEIKRAAVLPQNSTIHPGQTLLESPGQNENSKNMTDLNVIKVAIMKMMNESDLGEEGMNMGELGNRLAKRYPDFDVRNFGDTKLSRFLNKFDFLEIKSRGKNTSMWVSLKKEFENTLEDKKTEEPKTRRRYNRKKTDSDKTGMKKDMDKTSVKK